MKHLTNPWMVVVHMQNEENYQQVFAYLQKNPELELEPYPERYSLAWKFDGKTEDDLTTERLNDLGQHFPEIPFQCYKYDVNLEKERNEVLHYTSFRGRKLYWGWSSSHSLALMHWHREMGVTYEEVIFKTEQVFQMALAKARSEEGWCYNKAVAGFLFYYVSLHSLHEEDFTWLKVLADDRYVPACCLLLRGMEEKIYEWDEVFVDEDTGEEVTISRSENIEGALFEPDETLREQLTQTIYDLAEKQQIDNEEIRTACYYLRDVTSLCLLLVERGEEDMAKYIRDPDILQEMCDKGNKWATWEMYLEYFEGDEEHGIFIDLKRAREYYDLALQRGYELDEFGWKAWDDSDDPGEEDPHNYEYVLTGDSSTLDSVKKLINDLCQRFGTPDNEFGLYVPQRILMKKLVGSDTEYYRGNIIRMKQKSPNRLVITTEADQGEPLLYALRYSFKNLDVEMKELAW